MSMLGIVPARGGSKGIPGKNIVPVRGRPLIAFTIEPALAAKANGVLCDLVVSTDSEDIAGIARDLGARVPGLRPSAISGDRAKSVDAILHEIERCRSEGREFTSVMLLQPTSPLRTQDDIETAAARFIEGGAPSLISCYLEPTITDLVTYRREGDVAVPLNPDHNRGVRRQEHEHLFVRNGAIYITAVEYLETEGRIISDRPLLHEMPKRRSLNVDTGDDLRLFEALLAIG